MSEVIVTMNMKLKPEAADGFCGVLPEMIKDTAKRPGFVDIQIVRHKDDPNNVLFVERWATEQHYHDYIAWRTERGDMDGVAAVLADAPKLDFWPTTAAKG